MKVFLVLYLVSGEAVAKKIFKTKQAAENYINIANELTQYEWIYQEMKVEE